MSNSNYNIENIETKYLMNELISRLERKEWANFIYKELFLLGLLYGEITKLYKNNFE